jgi:hypothetical protein
VRPKLSFHSTHCSGQLKVEPSKLKQHHLIAFNGFRGSNGITWLPSKLCVTVAANVAALSLIGFLQVRVPVTLNATVRPPLNILPVSVGVHRCPQPMQITPTSCFNHSHWQYHCQPECLLLTTSQAVMLDVDIMIALRSGCFTKQYEFPVGSVFHRHIAVTSH